MNEAEEIIIDFLETYMDMDCERGVYFNYDLVERAERFLIKSGYRMNSIDGHWMKD